MRDMLHGISCRILNIREVQRYTILHLVSKERI